FGDQGLMASRVEAEELVREPVEYGPSRYLAPFNQPAPVHQRIRIRSPETGQFLLRIEMRQMYDRRAADQEHAAGIDRARAEHADMRIDAALRQQRLCRQAEFGGDIRTNPHDLAADWNDARG